MGSTSIDVEHCLEAGIFTSKEIQRITGLSQPAVSRQLRLLGERVVKIPNGRHPQYALTTNAFGSDDKIPLCVVDINGNNTIPAIIRPLKMGGYFVELRQGGSTLFLGVEGTGYFPDDLPYYLLDLRPQGFVGQQIARELAERSNEFPTNPDRWRTNHIGRYLLSNGEDVTGNIQFGETVIFRLRRTPTAYKRSEYIDIAQEVLDGELTGSSTGGDQPKFTVFSEEKSAHVLVKFSPPGNNDVAERWRDVLITEYHATEALHAQNVPAAETELIEIGDRLFLESERFDRSGQHGRSSMISLQMVDAEFVGNGSDWPIVTRSLYEQKLLTSEHHYDACFLWEFGYLINNTDMHLGNLSVGMQGNLFSVLPAYDMCSMGFAPIRSEVRPFSFSLTRPHSRLNALEEFGVSSNRVRDVAIDFWERVANDSRISGDFRNFLSQGNPVTRMDGQLALDVG